MAVIAEAGLWHNGDVEEAIDLVRAAKECGADAIKFQMFIPNRPLFCAVEGDDKRRRFWNESAMSQDDWDRVRQAAKREDIGFGASIFQTDAVRILNDLNPDFVKVASRAAVKFPYDFFEGPFYISTGMTDTEERQKISHRMMRFGAQYEFLHCVSKYPTPLKFARWPGTGGLSDHSGNPLVAIEALARGCKTVEVHFATHKKMNCPDYAVSLGVRDLSLICEARDVFAEMRNQ